MMELFTWLATMVLIGGSIGVFLWFLRDVARVYIRATRRE